LYGLALSDLEPDQAAKARCEKYLTLHQADDATRQVARRYRRQPEFAHVLMARSTPSPPPMDGPPGKVVLIAFWSTSCASCREALPNNRRVATKFQGQALAIPGVSLDSEEQKSNQFVTKNELVWPPYGDAGSNGAVATLFGVKAVPPLVHDRSRWRLAR
jgi:peroxiredoxin